jgi:hypothetical protein
MQKIFTSANLYIRIFFSAPPVKQFLSRSLYLGNLLSLSVYVWVKLLFHDFPIELAEEAALILRLMFTGTCLAGLCIGGFQLLMFAADYYAVASKKRKITRACISLSKQKDNNVLLPEYTLFNQDDAFAIDKTGGLRYVIKKVKSVETKEKKTPA